MTSLKPEDCALERIDVHTFETFGLPEKKAFLLTKDGKDLSMVILPYSLYMELDAAAERRSEIEDLTP